MPASRRARATTFAPRSWPSRPGLATRTRIWRCSVIWLPLRLALDQLDEDAVGGARRDEGDGAARGRVVDAHAFGAQFLQRLRHVVHGERDEIKALALVLEVVRHRPTLAQRRDQLDEGAADGEDGLVDAEALVLALALQGQAEVLLPGLGGGVEVVDGDDDVVEVGDGHDVLAFGAGF